ncbi:MAG: hypothetical protein JO282_05665 [Alphaproteobacteria bacterium]|nr:hypothetical protein [Alphaproteobacteria bacterium]
MDASQRAYLERRHDLRVRRRRGAVQPRPITGFAFTGPELSGWTLYRARRDDRHAPRSIRTLWHRGDPMAELLSIDLWECPSTAAATDQLVEILGNIQSDAIERKRGDAVIGDIEFALDDSMILFQRVNIVVFIRNAGPKIVGVGAVARAIDALLVRLSGS